MSAEYREELKLAKGRVFISGPVPNKEDLPVDDPLGTVRLVTSESVEYYCATVTAQPALQWVPRSQINLPVGAYQPYDPNLSSLAALTTTSIGRSLLQIANGSEGQSILGLGSIATANSGDYILTSSIGDTVQAHSARLDAIAGQSNTSYGLGFLTLADYQSARAKLQLGTAANYETSQFLQAGNDLSDLANAASARSNLGLGGAALRGDTFYLRASNNLSDIPDAAAARENLGITGGGGGGDLLSTNNLSDVANTGTAFNNLLGATSTATGRSLVSIANAGAGRTILGLGTASISASTDFQPASANLTTLASNNGANLTGLNASSLAIGTVAKARLPLALQIVSDPTIHTAELWDEFDRANTANPGGGAGTATSGQVYYYPAGIHGHIASKRFVQDSWLTNYLCADLVNPIRNAGCVIILHNDNPADVSETELTIGIAPNSFGPNGGGLQIDALIHIQVRRQTMQVDVAATGGVSGFVDLGFVAYPLLPYDIPVPVSVSIAGTHMTVSVNGRSYEYEHANIAVATGSHIFFEHFTLTNTSSTGKSVAIERLWANAPLAMPGLTAQAPSPALTRVASGDFSMLSPDDSSISMGMYALDSNTLQFRWQTVSVMEVKTNGFGGYWVQPGFNGNYSLGTSAKQWSDVRSVLGTFTGAVTAGSFLTSGTLASGAQTVTGAITASGLVTGSGFTTAGNVLSSGTVSADTVNGNTVAGNVQVGAPTVTAVANLIVGGTLQAFNGIGANGQILSTDGTVVTWGEGALPRGYLAGLALANNGTDAVNDIDIAIGECRSSTNAYNLKLLSGITKRLDASWAVGSGNGGLDTGSIANAVYHVWLIRRSDTGVVDALFSLSATSPTMPTNYDAKRRIGSVIRSGSTILAFLQNGDEFTWKAPALDISTTAQGASSISYPLTIPTGFKMLAILQGGISSATLNTDVLIRDPDTTDAAPSPTATPGVTCRVTVISTLVTFGVIYKRTDTSAQVAIRATAASTTIRAATLGWVDRRGRDD